MDKDDDYYVICGDGGVDDAAIQVYLPREPKLREKGALVIANALQRAKIPVKQ